MCRHFIHAFCKDVNKIKEINTILYNTLHETISKSKLQAGKHKASLQAAQHTVNVRSLLYNINRPL